MANYKYEQYFTKSNHQAFDDIQTPGVAAPHSGIYRCEGCGDNVAANYGDPLPPQNHHQHSPNQGKIRWKLIAATR